jgi:hypothetical protein
MAKITARGDSQRVRYRHLETGAELILTTRGRLLSKEVKGAPIKLSEDLSGWRDHGFERAFELAQEKGMVRV